MSKKLVAVLLISFVIATFAQDQADTPNFGGDQDFNADQFNPDYQRQQEQMMEIQRAKLWGCYFVTKNKIISKAEAISKLTSPENGEAYFKKITTDVMKTCLERIQPEESQKVIESLTKRDFNIEDWDYIHNFNIEKYQGEIQLELDSEEKFVYEYYQKLDENIRNHYEEEAEKEELERRKNVDYEPKIAGLSLKETSPFVKTLYALGVAGAVIAVFLFAYKTLFKDEETPYERAKRERKDKKRTKSQ